MKREIKFRALELDVGAWVYGSFLSIDGYHMSQGVPDLNKPCTRYYIVQDGNRHEIDEDTLGQSTGLVDRNGVEIYEDDIVVWGHLEGYIELSGLRTAVVDLSVYSDGLTFNAFEPIQHRFKIGNFAYSKCTDKCMDIIGNIHQNQNMLKQEG